MELGVTAYERHEGSAGAGRVWLYRIVDRADVTATDLEDEAFDLPDDPKPDVLAKVAPARAWADAHVVRLPARRVEMEFVDEVDYWRDLERVQFSTLAQDALAGRDILED